MSLRVHLTRLWEGAKEPMRGSITEAGYTLYYAPQFRVAREEGIIESSYNLHNREKQIFSSFETGWAFDIDSAYWAMINETQTMAERGINVLGGVVDPSNQGHIKVVLKGSLEKVKSIKPGDAIGNITFFPRINVEFKIAD